MIKKSLECFPPLSSCSGECSCSCVRVFGVFGVFEGVFVRSCVVSRKGPTVVTQRGRCPKTKNPRTINKIKNLLKLFPLSKLFAPLPIVVCSTSSEANKQFPPPSVCRPTPSLAPSTTATHGQVSAVAIAKTSRPG